MATTATEDDWLTVEEAAGYLKVSPSTLYRWRDEGVVRFYKLGERMVRLKRDELAALPHLLAPAISEEELEERREWARRARARLARQLAEHGEGLDSAIIVRQMRDERERELGGAR